MSTGARPAAGALVFARYRLEEQLGLGGSAEVWRARDVSSRQLVAVKLLHPHLLSDPRARQRLAHEARAASGLRHEGIVPVVDVVLREDAAAIVFEFVEGETLAGRIARSGPLEAREAACIAAQVAEALAHAHDRGVIHRDVKPSNIMLPPAGGARLVDFGIARSLEESQAALTLTGSVVGTLRYMAPEQLASTSVDARVDVFALGAVLYEMLAGHPPFPAETPVALAEQQRTAPPSIPGVSPGLMAITLAALQPDPAARVPSAAELGRLLHSWLSDDPVPAWVLGAGMSAAGGATISAARGAGGDEPTAVVATVTAGPGPSATHRSGWSATRLAALATGLAGIALAGALALPALSRTDPGPRPDAARPANAVSATKAPTTTPRPTPAVTPPRTPPVTTAPAPAARPPVRPATQPAEDRDRKDDEQEADGNEDRDRDGDDDGSGRGGEKGKGGGNSSRGGGGRGNGGDD